MTIVVEIAGPLLTVQDGGRIGRAHQGVARSGAFDQRARNTANRLVGNPADAAVLEALLGSCAFIITEPVVVAVTGARSLVTVNGGSVGENMALSLRAGDRLNIGMPTEGLRTYVSLRGGVGGPMVLGSRSYDSLGDIGPAPLTDGCRIVCAQCLPQGDPWFEPIPIRRRQHSAEPMAVEIVFGPRSDWLTPGSLRTLTDEVWTIDAASNRIGVRLNGATLRRPPSRENADLPSEAMIPGAIQIPPNGSPIILGPDAGTTGGYPVVAVVRRRSLDDVAQLRPGDRLRFICR